MRLSSSSKHGLVRGSILDITDRKVAEAALRASEARYRSLVNNATYGIYWVNFDGTFLFANPALVKMLGYDSIVRSLSFNGAARVLAWFCSTW